MVNETKKNVKVEILETWMGYGLSIVNPDAPKFHLYVKKVYGGKVTWVTDYTHSKKYKSKRAAEAVAKKIEEGKVR